MAETFAVKFTGDWNIFKDAPRRILNSVYKGMEEGASDLVEAVKAVARGRDLKASIASRRRGMTVTIGALDNAPPWAAIDEFGGEIHAKRVSFYIQNIRQTVGPMLYIPLVKGEGGPGFWVRSKRGNYVKISPGPGGEAGPPLAVLKPMVYHPAANRGKGWLAWVIERDFGKFVKTVEEAIDAEFKLRP